jgi:NAD(P)H-hydrate repair Nnr-like enzyme with NAD(P)H-hydrate epimerase domain
MQRLFTTQHGDPVSAVTADEVKRILERLVREWYFGVAEMIESAARSILPIVFELLGRDHAAGPVAIVAGTGHTGAVGCAVGRHLANYGVAVTAYAVGTSEIPEGKRQRSAFRASSGTFFDSPSAFRDAITSGSISNTYLLIDALIGGGPYEIHDQTVVETLQILASDRLRNDPESAPQMKFLALEIPSGVDPTTGVAGDVAFTADMTISFAIPRTGLSASECGAICVADVGIPPEVFRKEPIVTYPCRFRGEPVLRLRSF